MSQNIFALLKSDDPAQRRQAIITLGKSGDARAIPYLADAFRTDPDPQLRELAKKAGRYIQQQTAQQEAAAPQAPSPPPSEPSPQPEPGLIVPDVPLYEMEDAEHLTDEEREAYEAGWLDMSRLKDDVTYGSGTSIEVEVSQRDREKAKTAYDRAMDLHFKGEMAEAVIELSKSLELNPNLARDRLIGNLAHALTGLDVEDAVKMIQDEERRDMLITRLGGTPPSQKGGFWKRLTGG